MGNNQKIIEDFDKGPIRIFIVPHSHTDPGWIVTFEEYYRNDVFDILNNVFTELKMDSKKKFAWAETSYLRMFYEDLNSY